MKFLILSLLLLATLSLRAEPPGINQSSELLTLPAGEKVLRWHGHTGRSYFLQVSDPNDHLRKWTWAPIIEGGNDEEISYEVDGTADKGFFRLKYIVKVPHAGQTLETADFDYDYINNWTEITEFGTDPTNPDTDGDLLDDYADTYYYGTNPLDPDSDDDGLLDGNEVHIHFSSPVLADSDNDGLTDGVEVSQTQTEPNNSDTDGDGEIDGVEFAQGTDPKSATSFSYRWNRVTRRLQYDFDDYPEDKHGTLSKTAEWNSALNTTENLTEPIPWPDLKGRLEALAFPATPPESGGAYGITASNGTASLIPNPPCYHASLNHNRFWLERAAASAEPLVQHVIIETRRDVDGVVTREVALKTVTIPANQTISDPIDLKNGFINNFTGNTSHMEYFTETMLVLDIVDKSKQPLTELKVGKMYPTVLMGNGLPAGSQVTVALDNDPDRFFVRVKSYEPASSAIQMKFETVDNPDASYNDNPTEYTFVEKDGYRTTESMVLVSDHIDDDHMAGATTPEPDDSSDDRTHKIQLGGNFKISAIKVGLADWVAADIKLPVKKKKTVRVQFVNCTYGLPGITTPCWTTPQIVRVKKHLQERYAQVGIEFDFQPTLAGAKVDSDGEMTDSEVPSFDGSVGKIYIPQETKDLIDHGPPNDLHNTLMIYLVKKLGQYAGIATPPKYVESFNVRFHNKVLLANADLRDFTAGHEALHVLTDAAHAPPTYADFNTERGHEHTLWSQPLVNPFYSEMDRADNISVGSTKRISIAQEAAAQSSPLAK